MAFIVQLMLRSETETILFTTSFITMTVKVRLCYNDVKQAKVEPRIVVQAGFAKLCVQIKCPC